MIEEQATLGGGCFWCLEAAFLRLRGVTDVASGYAGGHVAHPSYRLVCGGDTGHAEVVQLRFDPRQLSYAQVLQVFFTVHDPTTVNRQGNDVGTQYRSIILTHTPEQAELAHQAIAALNAARVWPQPVVTEVCPLTRFWPAEIEHQNYYAQHSTQPYCALVVAPKVRKVEQAFGDWLR